MKTRSLVVTAALSMVIVLIALCMPGGALGRAAEGSVALPAAARGPAGPAAPNAITLNATEDATVLSNDPLTAHGSDTTLGVRFIAGEGGVRRTLVKFELATRLPAGAV